MAKRAIFPGSFDPITSGHVDLIKRSRKFFDEVIVLVAGSVQKSKSALFDLNERKDLITEIFKEDPNVSADICTGLIMDYARDHDVQAVVRGLRATSDFEHEYMMTAMNRELNSEVETFFIMADKNLFFVSSSMLKEVAIYGGDIAKYVPANVASSMERKVNELRK